MTESAACTLFLCGDVMTGRGVDQILRTPVDQISTRAWSNQRSSTLRLLSARMAAFGAALITRTFGAWLWMSSSAGDRPHAYQPRDQHYHERPRVIQRNQLPHASGECRRAVGRRHRLRQYLRTIMSSIGELRVTSKHSTHSRQAAFASPAPVERVPRRRPQPSSIWANSVGFWYSPSADRAGVPAEWSAAAAHPGVNWIGEYSARTTTRIRDLVAAHKRPGDFAIASSTGDRTGATRFPMSIDGSLTN